MGDILILLLLAAFVGAILFVIRHDSRLKKDKKGLNYYNSFELICPVCKNKNRYSKEAACKFVTQTSLDNIKAKEISCSGCAVDLSGLYFSQDFVRNAITESERLKGSKELTMQYLEELEKLKAVTSALGESYVGEVPSMHSNGKQRV